MANLRSARPYADKGDFGPGGESETDGLLRDSPNRNQYDGATAEKGQREQKQQNGGAEADHDDDVEPPGPFDVAIDRIGFGRGQMFVLLAAAMANASDSVELAAVSFAITTTMECDLELDSGRKGW
jgi:hypothetical protein